MELLIVVLLLLVIAGLAFAWMKSRARGHAGGLPGRGRGVRGRRRAAVAARHDPMAEAVERHSAATDPQEAAEAELRLQAQANRVASELHAREAATLESQAGSGGLSRSVPPPRAEEPVYRDGTPVYDDVTPAGGNGRPAYEDSGPAYRDEPPVHDDGRPAAAGGEQPAYLDERGRPVYEDERPRY